MTALECVGEGLRALNPHRRKSENDNYCSATLCHGMKS